MASGFFDRLSICAWPRIFDPKFGMSISNASTSGQYKNVRSGSGGKRQRRGIEGFLKPVSICVVGSGYVGLVAAVCFAEIGHNVICVDNDEARIAELNSGSVPIYEEHLLLLLTRHLNKNVRFSGDLKDAVRSSAAVFIAVGTPQGDAGAADLSHVEAVVSDLADAITKYTVIVEKSTVPVFTNEWIRRVLGRSGLAPELFDVVSNPEFLREGTAVMDFLYPDRIVVGADAERAASLLRDIYAPLTGGSYYKQPNALRDPFNRVIAAKLLVTSTQSAEIIKHASNAFLALKISFINAVANLAEAAQADIEDISTGIGLDRRIGSQFFRAGIGYGGSCFPKDVAAFRWIADECGVDFQLLAEVQRINDLQKDIFVNKIRSTLWTLKGKKLAVLGLAFKRDTDDIRESPAIAIVRKLLESSAIISAYDPAAMSRAQKTLPPSEHMHYASSPYEAAEGAAALIILTDWQEFVGLDLAELDRKLKFPIIIDGRNLYDPNAMRESGFTYISVGRPAVIEAKRARLSSTNEVTSMSPATSLNRDCPTGSEFAVMGSNALPVL
jgi:UDPglucose 6-dehydrogenase